MEISPEPLKGAIKNIYRSQVEANYQYALLEKRMELADQLKRTLDEATA